MARGPFAPFLRSLDAVRRSADTDGQLLRRFIADHDESAFAELVRRHGSLVWGVCRQTLGHDQDAEDAFQASFLLLARRARTVRNGEAVASWLHGTAWRVAAKMRRAAAGRTVRERRVSPRPTGDVAADVALRELQAILHEEVARLPAKCREPFVLCVLEGRGRAEVARELGWNEGTLSTRLADARKRLRARLARRGVDVAAALCAVELARQPAPAALLVSTYAAATGGTISSAVAVLTRGLIASMFTTKVYMATAFALLAISLAIGTAGLRGLGRTEAVEPAAQEKKAAAPPDVPVAPQAATKPGCAVTVSGMATDSDGRPVAGANVYLTVSNRILEKPL
ncbi:MAG TPA: RNA polymerase sigma factor, partial [Gemmataceae bacterium]|nr:RNA polymerase sigma factor [Gemmataceae bacterium]